MSDWKVTIHRKGKARKAVLVEGMPGIGNVGKITADLLVEQLKAVKAASFHSHCLPNSVFVKEDNTVEMPKIEMHYAKKNGQEFYFLVGDVQPMKEEDSHRFAEAVLGTAKKLGCTEVIALGGIGLSEMPEDSKVYCTGNDKAQIMSFVKLGANNKLYGVVGPIMGITGLTLGLGKDYGLKCIALLAETYAAPMHVGLREAKGIIRIIGKKYKLGINLGDVEKDIKKFENELKTVSKQQELQVSEHPQDTSYIG